MTSHDQRKKELTNTSKKDEAIHTPSASKLVRHKVGMNRHKIHKGAMMCTKSELQLLPRNMRII